MVKVNHAFALAILVLLSACAAWQPAKTFEHKLAYGYSVYTAVVNAAAAGVEAGTLTKVEGAQVLRISDEARVVLDASKGAMGLGDLSTAEAQLVLATNLLTQLQAYLRTRK